MRKLEIIKDNLEKIKFLLDDNTPISEIARIVGVKYETLTRNLKKLNIPFKTNPHREGKKHIEKRKPASYYFNSNIRVSIPVLRKKLIEEGIKENKCENPECGLTDWHGKFLPLELHHINGNHYDNRLENLILLCPNCHAQIHGYNKPKEKINKVNRVKRERKNKEKEKKQCFYCGEFFIPKNSNQKFCSTKCVHKSQEKNKITKDELIKKLKIYKTFIGVAKSYGISDKALIKWCKKYNIPTHKKEMIEYIKNI